MLAHEPAVNTKLEVAALAAEMVVFSWRMVTADQELGWAAAPAVHSSSSSGVVGLSNV